MKITTADAVLALKKRGTAHHASALAADLGCTSRAVATALRAAVADGRVTMRFTKQSAGAAFYRFVRLTAK